MEHFKFRYEGVSNQEKEMNWMKKKSLIAVVCMTTASVLQAATLVEKPAVLPEAMLSITASDVHGLLDGVGVIAAQASPMMNGMMLKSMLGMQLGDPSLAGIAPGKGLSIIALDPTNIFAVIEVTEAQSAAYGAVATSKGIQSKYENGLLVIGQTPEQVAKGVSLAGAVQRQLLAKRTPTLRIAGQPAEMISRHDAEIDGFLKMMPAMLGMSMTQSPGVNTNSAQTTAKILEAELRIILSLAGQCEQAEVVLSPDNGALRINKTFVPKAGTRLATLINAPKLNQPNPKISTGILDSAAMLFECTMANPAALTDFFVAETESLIKTMSMEVENLPALLECMKKWVNVYGGTFCESVDFGGEDGFSVGYLMDLKDEKAALELFRTMEQDMAPFFKLYEDLGMPMSMTFKENTRQYKGAQVHQLKLDIDMKQLQPDQSAAMNMMNMSNMVYEVAIVDGIMVYAMGSIELDTLVDRLKAGAPSTASLKARSVYPAGGFYYFDYDIAAYISGLSAMMPVGPSNPLKQIGELLQGASPLTSAGFKDGGRVMWSMNVPGDLIAKYGQAVMMMQMQKMQQQGGAPQAMPVQ
jgi:hypothetical protein